MRSDFIVHNRIIQSSLSLLHQIYEGALGKACLPPDSRIAKDPLDVLAQMASILNAAQEQIKEYHGTE